METTIIKIGNSHGLIIPKGILNKLGFNKKANLLVKDGKIQISPIKDKKQPRQSWEKQFIQAIKKEHKPEQVEHLENDFDKNEWTW